METFIAAYAVVWLVVVLYLLQLRANQFELERLARTIEARVNDLPEWTETDPRSDRGA